MWRHRNRTHVLDPFDAERRVAARGAGRGARCAGPAGSGVDHCSQLAVDGRRSCIMEWALFELEAGDLETCWEHVRTCVSGVRL